MQDVTPDTFERYNAFLNELLSGENAPPYSLPRLIHQKGPFEEFLDKIKEWLNHKTGFSLPSGSWDLSGFFLLLKWVLIGVLAALLLWAIYRTMIYYRKRSAAIFPRRGSPRPADAVFNLESAMAQKIKRALDQNEFDRAGRLRWKLFLKRLNRDPDLTPQEFETAPAWKKIVGSDSGHSKSQNQLMFGKRPKALEDYLAFDRFLFEMEKRYLSHAA